jgi:Dynein heavy chain AAA lid domain
VSATIQRSLKRLPASVLDDIEDIDNGLWRKLVFMLSVVHAAVSGRAKYQRVGWSKRYKFSTADFLAAVDVFSAYVRDQQQEMSEVSIPWRQLQFVVLESVYGGRAADRHDLRVLRAYGDMWVHDVVTQLGYTFSYCRAVSNEGSVTPALGWLAWRDMEPPIPPRDPFSSQLSTKLLRLGSSTNISSTLRTSSGSSSMMHTHRRISVAKALPSPPDLDVESDKACLRAPTDSQAKRLSDFWRYVDSLDGDDHPEVSHCGVLPFVSRVPQMFLLFVTVYPSSGLASILHLRLKESKQARCSLNRV